MNRSVEDVYSSINPAKQVDEDARLYLTSFKYAVSQILRLVLRPKLKISLHSREIPYAPEL